MSNSKINSWDWDIRVRERNLRNGILTDKDLEKQRHGLPDLVEQSEPVTVVQPAVGSGAAAGADVADDDDDEEDEASS